MTNINLLNDITQKTRAPKQSKSLFKRFFSGKNSVPKKSPAEPAQADNKKASEKKKKQPSGLIPILLFILPLIGCLYAETYIQEIMNKAIQKMSQKIEAEAETFNSSYESPPNVEKWQHRHEALQNAVDVLSTYHPLDIQLSIEYFRQMTSALPKAAWINNIMIKFNPEDGSHHVDIKGYAFTSETVLLFLTQLKTQPLFNQVELKFSKPTQIHGIEEHEFHVVSKSTRSDINALGVYNHSWLYNRLYPLVWRSRTP
jgi:Tfp pilus assembly protein PilN